MAGTTGAGKSELLQTMIVSLATSNSPGALEFVLIDYKGGSAFKDCSRLPHTLGMVTDLDSHLTERALASLGAELRRRKLVLDREGCKDVDDYYRRLDAGLVVTDGSIGRLLIIIDEFGFAGRRAARLRGRADRHRPTGPIARRPSASGDTASRGVVSPEIRANANLRIALRVTDTWLESTDVIGTQDASRNLGSDAGSRLRPARSRSPGGVPNRSHWGRPDVGHSAKADAHAGPCRMVGPCTSRSV